MVYTPLYLDITGESLLHALVQEGLKFDIQTKIIALIPTIHNATVRDRMSKVLQTAHADIMRTAIILKQGDISFCDSDLDRLPSIVGEIS